jgi:phosphate-selective porin OprO/OprP
MGASLVVSGWLLVGALADARTAEKPEAPPVEVTAAPGRGVTVRRTDGTSSLTLRARVQLRDTVAVQDGSATNEVTVRTVRLIAAGNLLRPELTWFVQLALGPADFEPGNASPVFDAYLEYAATRDLQLRVGQFFVPFDRARTVREFALQFVDRQQVVTELNLDRDIGVMVFSSDLFGLGGRLAYQVGLFGGSGRNRSGFDRPEFLYVGRLMVRPLGPLDDDVEGDLERRAAPKLAVGLAGAFNHGATRVRSTTGASYVLGTFDYVHLAADMVFKWRGLSLLAEVLYRASPLASREGVIAGAAAREDSRSGLGYLVQAGLMVTDRVECTARWDQLVVLRPTDPSFERLVRTQGREVGVGLNVYFNGHQLKAQADWALRFGDAAHPSHLFRVQLDATF